MQQRDNGTILQVLVRSVLALNVNIDRHSVQKALNSSDLSWKMFKEENGQFVMKRLQNMLNLNKAQSLGVYDSMRGYIPDHVHRRIDQSLSMVHDVFYEEFVLKCMSFIVFLCSLLRIFLCDSSQTVTVEHLGTEQVRMDIVNKYKVMYQDLTEKIRQNVDQRQLGLDVDLPVFDDEQGPCQGSNIKLFTGITLKWSAQCLGVGSDDLALDCTDSDKCRAMKRIVFIMDLFGKHFLKHYRLGMDSKDGEGDTNFIKIFTHCLSDYDVIALLNDLEHIRDHNDSIPSMHCQHGTNSEQCFGETMRQYRGNDSDESMDGALKEYLDRLSLNERTVLNTCSRIHSFIYHEDHFEETVEDNEKEGSMHKSRPITARLKKGMSSKFVNEINERKSENVESKRMDTLFTDLERNGFSTWKRGAFMAELCAQQYDSDAIVDDLVDEENDPFNHYKDSNLFPLIQHNPFLAKNIKKHFNIKGNDDDELSPFSFGKNRLYHWKGNTSYRFENRPGYVGSPRHGSLKEECLNNTIHQMTMREFSEMLNSAFMFRQCDKGRSFKAKYHGGDNDRYEVRAASPLSVSYIFVLLMYCNLTDLQYKYKKIGCRERDGEQTLEELIESNREIAIWHRLLFEVVHFFGDLASSKQVYYTGLSTKLAFPSFAPVFNCPISTTGLILYLFIPSLCPHCPFIQCLNSEHRRR